MLSPQVFWLQSHKLSLHIGPGDLIKLDFFLILGKKSVFLMEAGKAQIEIEFLHQNFELRFCQNQECLLHLLEKEDETGDVQY
ncbi:MAG: hypothetical protein CBB74_03525 [Owenweeksia sp. TMED14]|nr:MAG: hypothetical protein CBB74_03525 [Owenweeksia sp. TMED14]